MKIIITGSLGHISKPLTKELVHKGHSITVISSKAEKQTNIEALGATAAIGSLEDVPFLENIFSGADAVYCMIPPNYTEADPVAYYQRIGSNYAAAIQQSGIKRVVHLSSFGADLNKGTGVILGSHHVELVLNELKATQVTHMRPTSFYYNLIGFIDMVKKAGFIAANYGGADKVVMVSPIDIAAAVAEEITAAGGNKVRYVASDELSCNEIAGILGAAIGKPDLQWLLISDEEMHEGLLASGLPGTVASALVDLYASLHNGNLARDYYLNKPAVMGKVKLVDFASEFAAAFNKN